MTPSVERRERTVYTHTHLWFAAERHRTAGLTSNDKGDFMASIILATFAFEAYLNFLGEQRIKFWKEIDRLSWDRKLRATCLTIGFKLDLGRRPFQSVLEGYRFRNFMAHASTESMAVDIRPGSGPPLGSPFPLMKWEILCQVAPTSRIVEDAREAMLALHKKAGLQHGALGMHSVQGASTR